MCLPCLSLTPYKDLKHSDKNKGYRFKKNLFISQNVLTIINLEYVLNILFINECLAYGGIAWQITKRPLLAGVF